MTVDPEVWCSFQSMSINFLQSDESAIECDECRIRIEKLPDASVSTDVDTEIDFDHFSLSPSEPTPCFEIGGSP